MKREELEAIRGRRFRHGFSAHGIRTATEHPEGDWAHWADVAKLLAYVDELEEEQARVRELKEQLRLVNIEAFDWENQAEEMEEERDTERVRAEKAEDRVRKLEDRAEWRCDNCGDAYPDGRPGAWRHGFHGPEHACEGRHPQAGHSSATWVGSEVTGSALAQLKADMVRANTDLQTERARVRELEESLSINEAFHAETDRLRLTESRNSEAQRIRAERAEARVLELEAELDAELDALPTLEECEGLHHSIDPDTVASIRSVVVEGAHPEKLKDRIIELEAEALAHGRTIEDLGHQVDEEQARVRELKAELDRVRGDFMDAAGILDNEFAEVRGSQGRDYAKKVSPLGVAEARVRELEGQRYRGRQDDLDENGDLPFRAVRIAEGVGKQHGIEDTVWYGECWTLAEAIADAMADAREGPCARVRELEEAARLVAETYQQLEVRGDVAAELAAACAGKALLEVLDGPTPDQPAEAKP